MRTLLRDEAAAGHEALALGAAGLAKGTRPRRICGVSNLGLVVRGVIACIVVLLLVLPAWAQSESVTKSGVSGATPPGGSGPTTIAWSIDYGLTSASPLNVTLNDTWSSGQTLVVASVETPGGYWNANPSGPLGVDFTNPLVAPDSKGHTQPFPRPLAAGVLLSGTGDGYNPVVTANGKLMGINHHNNPAQIWCYDLNTGAACTGYPMSSGINTGTAPFTVAVGNRIYVNPDSLDNQCCGSPGLDQIFCWDATTDSPCGLSGPTGKSSILTAVNGKLFTLNQAGELLCFDPANSLSSCAGFTTRSLGMPARDASHSYINFGDDMLAVGSKLYVANFERKLTCFDVAANTTCAGWPSSPVNTTASGAVRCNLFPRLSVGGTVTGVCVAGSGTDATCYDLDGSNPAEVGLGNVHTMQYPGLSANADVYVGTRVFFADFGANLSCFDWSTQMPCVGSDFDVNGHTTASANAPYGLGTDGVTVFSYGDGATLQSWNPLTGVTPSDRAATILTVDVDRFYCGSATPVAADWNTVELSDVDLTSGVEFTSLIVKLTDTDTGTVVFGPTEAIDTLGIFDISSVSSSVRRLRLEIEESPVNTVAWDDDVAPKATLTFSNTTPVQFCYRTEVTCEGSGVEYTDTINTTIDPQSAMASVTACAPSPYLAVSKIQPSPALVPGQSSTYTITVTNNGNLATATATVKDAIPIGLELVTASGVGWLCSPSSATSPVGTITCSYSGTLADSGGMSTIDVTVVPQAAYGNSTVINYVSVDPIGAANAPDPSTCTGVDLPSAGCGAPVSSAVAPTPCTLLPDGAACDDGLYCNGSDSCLDGACEGHAGDPCPGTECATCQEATDSCNVASGTTCDDTDAGTIDDQCDGLGECVGQVVTADYVVLPWQPGSASGFFVNLAQVAYVSGDVCVPTVRLRRSSDVQGDLIGTATSGVVARFSRSTALSGDLITGGPPATTDGLANVTIGGTVDQSGASPELVRCTAARIRAEARRDVFSAMASIGSVSVQVPHGESQNLVGAPGVAVVDVDAPGLKLGLGSKLILSGNGATQMIVRVNGDFLIRRGAAVELNGLATEQVLFIVDGSAKIGRSSHLAGTMMASGLIKVGRKADVQGQLLSSTNVRVGPSATVELHGFLGW